MINGFIGWQAYDLWGDFCFRTYAQSSNHPPNAPSTPTVSTTGTVGTSYSYSTSGTDPDTDQVKYCFDWGGGSPNSWTSLVSCGSAGSASHSWSSSGTFQVKAKSQDEHGFESGWSSPLSVTISAINNPPIKPSTPSGPSSGKPGTSYSFSSSAIDPDGDQVYLMFDWGDGTPMVWKGPFNSGYVDTESHIWDAQGAYSVKVQAKDTKDGISVWSDSLYNDISYSTGDDMLRRLAELLTHHLRPGDFIARWRVGDEFLVLLPATQSDAAYIVAERLRSAVEAISKGWEIPITISIGISSYPANGRTVEGLLLAVEKAAKLSKDRGKNQITVVGQN